MARNRSSQDQFIWVCVTAITNFITLPFLFRKEVLLKRHLVYETVLTAFTLLVSFNYHLCDSLDQPDLGPSSTFLHGMYLGKGKWHVLDNIGAIMCFVILLVHFTNYKNVVYSQINKYAMFWVVLGCQTRYPWDLRYTVYPILLQAGILVFKYVVVDRGVFPTFNVYHVKRSIFWQSIAFCCFFVGLDEDNDPYRMFHGLWHTFTGIASIHHWQAIHSHRENISTEVKHMKSEKLCV